jgi:hypothetical protein
VDSRGLLAAVICATVVLATSSAVLGQDESGADGFWTGGGVDWPPSFSATPFDQSPCAGGCDVGFGPASCRPRWTAWADFIIWDRIGSVNQTLVALVSGSVPFEDLKRTAGTEALNAGDFRQGFAGGPRAGLIRRDDSGCELEVSYFQIDGWTSARSVGPYDRKVEWLVMKAPGGFLQVQDSDQSMAWEYATRLHNAEMNVRWNTSRQLAVLAGFRWLQLHENLTGQLVPSEGFPPFWSTTTNNNLFGFQIGAEGKILDRGRFSIDGLVKAGLYDNVADVASEVSVFKVLRPSSGSSNCAAFVGEIGLRCSYQVSKGLALKAGYEAIWLEGVALAPGQIQDTYLTPPATFHASGVNCGSGVFFHGATVGLEYSF